MASPHRLVLAALLAFGLACAQPAGAAIVNVTATVDLNDMSISPGYMIWRPNAKLYDWDFTFAAGDTVNVTWQFADGKALRLTNTDAVADTIIQAFVEHLPIGNAIGSASFTAPHIALTGLSGSGLVSSFTYASNSAENPPGTYNTCCHGYNWQAVNALLPGADITFTGMQASFTHVSGSTAGSFFPDIIISGGNVQGYVVSAPIPTSAPATLVLLGLGLAGLAVRRRRSIR